MYTKKAPRHAIDFVFVLALLCVLAASSLAVVTAGALVYRKAAAGVRQDFDSETVLRYVTEKIRQSDGEALLLDEDGSPVLVLPQEGGEYAVRLYVFDGALCEIFSRSDAKFSPENGQRIARVGSFSAEREARGLIGLTCTDAEGRTSRCYVSLYGGQ